MRTARLTALRIIAARCLIVLLSFLLVDVYGGAVFFGTHRAAAEPVSHGLAAKGNQMWRQGSGGLAGTPEGQVLVPTGGSGSFRNRGDEFGAALAAGDFNGDGADDLAIAAPDEDAPNYSANEGTKYEDLKKGNGAVTIIYGSKSANGLSTASGNDQLWTIDNDGLSETNGGGGQFGFALSAGDFNGDGRDDLAIGIPYGGKGGSVAILYGSPAGLTSVGSQYIDQDTDGMSGAAEGGDRFGWSLASGRFNNDGFADLAIGVPGEDDDAGAVAVIYGSSGGLSAYAGPGNRLLEQGVDGMNDDAEAEVIPQLDEDEGDNFGYSLAAGRFKPGNTDDLAIGVPGEIIGALFDGPGKAGAVHIVYSDDSGLNPNGIYGDALWHQDVSYTHNGVTRDVEGIAEGGDRFGFSLAAGNFGHDMLDDLAIGIPGEDHDSGAVAILFGSVNGINLSPYDDQLIDQNTPGIEGVAEGNTLRGGDEFGRELAAGRFTASNYAGLAIGVPGEDDYAGGVAVIYGQASGLAADAGPGNQLWWPGNNGIQGSYQSSAMFGAALAAGDFNGDGADGLAVGAPVRNDHEGAAHVIYAAPVLDQSPPEVTSLLSGTKGDNGWYTDNVWVRWTVAEAESSDTLSTSGCADTYVRNDTAGTTVTCTASSEGGTTAKSVVIKRDSTKPIMEASFHTADGAPYFGYRWTRQNIEAAFICSDELSGVQVCPAPRLLDQNGDNEMTAIAVDAAGNSNEITYNGTLIDKSVPVTTATVSGSVYGDGSLADVYASGEPVIVTLAAEDDGLSPLSGTQYRINQGGWTRYYTPLLFTEGGEYEVDYRSADSAGNEEAVQTVVFEIRVDQLLPTIAGTITPAPNVNGWNNGQVTVSFVCDDNIGVASCSDEVAVADEVSGYPVEGFAEDEEGNFAGTTVFVNIDKTPPVTEETLLGYKYASEWYRQGYSYLTGYKKGEPVTLFLEGRDYSGAGSGYGSGVERVAYKINDGDWQTYTDSLHFYDGTYTVQYRAVDRAGNEEELRSISFQVDQTPPTLVGEITPPSNENGWNNTPVNVSFSCVDSLSGAIDDIINPPTISQEGEGVVERMECYDNALNKNEIATTVNLDLTAPVILITATTEDGEPYIAGTTADQPVILQFECFDALSGIDACSEPQVYGEGMNQSASGTAVDRAGNSTVVRLEGIHVDFTPEDNGDGGNDGNGEGDGGDNGDNGDNGSNGNNGDNGDNGNNGDNNSSGIDQGASSPVTAPLLPGGRTVIASPDGSLSVIVPAGAVPGGGGTLTIQPLSDLSPGEPGAGRVRIGNRAYDIRMTDTQGNAIHRLTGKIDLIFHADEANLPADIALEDVCVYYWDDELGAWLAVPTERDPEHHAIKAAVDHLTVFALLADRDLSLPNDIRGHQAEVDVLKLYSLDIVHGYADGAFRPDQAITRAEFAVLLAQATGLDPADASALPFADAVPGWAAGYVAAAVQAGWLHGHADSTFRANAPITREQLAVMAVAANDVAAKDEAPDYSDAAGISSWAYAAVREFVRSGWLPGYTEDSFRPKAEVTRAEASAIILQILRHAESK